MKNEGAGLEAQTCSTQQQDNHRPLDTRQPRRRIAAQVSATRVSMMVTHVPLHSRSRAHEIESDWKVERRGHVYKGLTVSLVASISLVSNLPRRHDAYHPLWCSSSACLKDAWPRVCACITYHIKIMYPAILVLEAQESSFGTEAHFRRDATSKAHCTTNKRLWIFTQGNGRLEFRMTGRNFPVVYSAALMCIRAFRIL